MPNRAIVTDGGIFPRGFNVETTFPFPLRRADELVDLCYGKALREPDRVLGTIPVYGTNGPCGWHNAPLTNGPGVILGRKGMGPLGVEWCESDFWVIDTAYFVRPKTKDIDLEYFYYLVKYIGLNHLKDGTSNPSLSRDTFGALLLPTPPLRTQRRVVEIVRTLDDKIELNRRMNETLEAMARRLFRSWFVDFDPVHAKAALRREHPRLSNADLSRRALPNMAPEIAELFPDSFEDSTLGPIPTGWRVDEIGNVVTVQGGGTPSTNSPAFWVGGIHPFCTPKDMAGLEAPVLLHTERHLTDAGVAKVSSGRLPIGTVLLSSRAPIGYLAIAQVPVTVNQGIIAMICDGELPNQYVLHWARTNDEAIVANANGSTFLEISKRNFRPLPVVIPHESIAESFQLQATEFHQAVARNLRESRELTICRDKLLPRLLSGEVESSESTEIQ